jgi:hypothetical protein
LVLILPIVTGISAQGSQVCLHTIAPKKAVSHKDVNPIAEVAVTANISIVSYSSCLRSDAIGKYRSQVDCLAIAPNIRMGTLKRLRSHPPADATVVGNGISDQRRYTR